MPPGKAIPIGTQKLTPITDVIAQEQSQAAQPAVRGGPAVPPPPPQPQRTPAPDRPAPGSETWWRTHTFDEYYAANPPKKPDWHQPGPLANVKGPKPEWEHAATPPEETRRRAVTTKPVDPNDLYNFEVRKLAQLRGRPTLENPATGRLEFADSDEEWKARREMDRQERLAKALKERQSIREKELEDEWTRQAGREVFNVRDADAKRKEILERLKTQTTDSKATPRSFADQLKSQLPAPEKVDEWLKATYPDDANGWTLGDSGKQERDRAKEEILAGNIPEPLKAKLKAEDPESWAKHEAAARDADLYDQAEATKAAADKRLRELHLSKAEKTFRGQPIDAETARATQDRFAARKQFLDARAAEAEQSYQTQRNNLLAAMNEPSDSRTLANLERLLVNLDYRYDTAMRPIEDALDAHEVEVADFRNRQVDEHLTATMLPGGELAPEEDDGLGESGALSAGATTTSGSEGVPRAASPSKTSREEALAFDQRMGRAELDRELDAINARLRTEDLTPEEAGQLDRRKKDLINQYWAQPNEAVSHLGQRLEVLAQTESEQARAVVQEIHDGIMRGELTAPEGIALQKERLAQIDTKPRQEAISEVMDAYGAGKVDEKTANQLGRKAGLKVRLTDYYQELKSRQDAAGMAAWEAEIDRVAQGPEAQRLISAMQDKARRVAVESSGNVAAMGGPVLGTMAAQDFAKNLGDRQPAEWDQIERDLRMPDDIQNDADMAKYLAAVQKHVKPITAGLATEYGEAFKRMAQKLFTGFIPYTNKLDLEAIERAPELYSGGDGLPDISKRPLGELEVKDVTDFVNGVRTINLPGSRKLTPEEQVMVRQKAEGLKRRVLFDQRMRDIFEGSALPLKASESGPGFDFTLPLVGRQRGTYAGAGKMLVEQGPYYLAMTNPVGFALTAMSFADDHLRRLNEEMPNLPLDKKAAISGTSGVIQAAIEKIQWVLLKKGLPKPGALTAKMVSGGLSKKIALGALNFTGVMTAEMAEEHLQQLTPFAAEWSFKQVYPDVRDEVERVFGKGSESEHWKKFNAEYYAPFLEMQAEMGLSFLPLVLIGAGVNVKTSGQQYNAGKELKNETKLKALGVAPEIRAQILGANEIHAYELFVAARDAGKMDAKSLEARQAQQALQIAGQTINLQRPASEAASQAIIDSGVQAEARYMASFGNVQTPEQLAQAITDLDRNQGRGDEAAVDPVAISAAVEFAGLPHQSLPVKSAGERLANLPAPAEGEDPSAYSTAVTQIYDPLTSEVPAHYRAVAPVAQAALAETQGLRDGLAAAQQQLQSPQADQKTAKAQVAAAEAALEEQLKLQGALKIGLGQSLDAPSMHEERKALKVGQKLDSDLSEAASGDLIVSESMRTRVIAKYPQAAAWLGMTSSEAEAYFIQKGEARAAREAAAVAQAKQTNVTGTQPTAGPAEAQATPTEAAPVAPAPEGTVPSPQTAAKTKPGKLTYQQRSVQWRTKLSAEAETYFQTDPEGQKYNTPERRAQTARFLNSVAWFAPFFKGVKIQASKDGKAIGVVRGGVLLIDPSRISTDTAILSDEKALALAREEITHRAGWLAQESLEWDDDQMAAIYWELPERFRDDIERIYFQNNPEAHRDRMTKTQWGHAMLHEALARLIIDKEFHGQIPEVIDLLPATVGRKLIQFMEAVAKRIAGWMGLAQKESPEAYRALKELYDRTMTVEGVMRKALEADAARQNFGATGQEVAVTPQAERPSVPSRAGPVRTPEEALAAAENSAPDAAKRLAREFRHVLSVRYKDDPVKLAKGARILTVLMKFIEANWPVFQMRGGFKNYADGNRGVRLRTKAEIDGGRFPNPINIWWVSDRKMIINAEALLENEHSTDLQWLARQVNLAFDLAEKGGAGTFVMSEVWLDEQADMLGALKSPDLIDESLETLRHMIKGRGKGPLSPARAWRRIGLRLGAVKPEKDQIEPWIAAVRTELRRLHGDIAANLNRRAEGEGGVLGASARNVTPEQDTAYLRAVESGDMETAQRMVDEAAKRAGYRRLFRAGQVDEVSEGLHFGTEAQANDLDTWGDQTETAIPYFVNTRGAVRLQDMGSWEDQVLVDQGYEPRDLDVIVYLNRHEGLGEEGAVDADGDPLLPHAQDALLDDEFLEYNPEAEDSYLVRVGNRVKSADPVTRDSSGRAIPLSERFNPENDSILYAASRELALPEDNRRAEERLLADLNQLVTLYPEGAPYKVWRAQLSRLRELPEQTVVNLAQKFVKRTLRARKTQALNAIRVKLAGRQKANVIALKENLGVIAEAISTSWKEGGVMTLPNLKILASPKGLGHFTKIWERPDNLKAAADKLGSADPTGQVKRAYEKRAFVAELLGLDPKKTHSAKDAHRALVEMHEDLMAGLDVPIKLRELSARNGWGLDADGYPLKPHRLGANDDRLIDPRQKDGWGELKEQGARNLAGAFLEAPEGTQPQVAVIVGGPRSGRRHVANELYLGGILDSPAGIGTMEASNEIPQFLEIINAGDGRAIDVIGPAAMEMAGRAEEIARQERRNVTVFADITDEAVFDAQLQAYKDAGYVLHLIGVVADYKKVGAATMADYKHGGWLALPDAMDANQRTMASMGSKGARELPDTYRIIDADSARQTFRSGDRFEGDERLLADLASRITRGPTGSLYGPLEQRSGVSEGRLRAQFGELPPRIGTGELRDAGDQAAGRQLAPTRRGPEGFYRRGRRALAVTPESTLWEASETLRAEGREQEGAILLAGGLLALRQMNLRQTAKQAGIPRDFNTFWDAYGDFNREAEALVDALIREWREAFIAQKPLALPLSIPKDSAEGRALAEWMALNPPKMLPATPDQPRRITYAGVENPRERERQYRLRFIQAKMDEMVAGMQRQRQAFLDKITPDQARQEPAEARKKAAPPKVAPALPAKILEHLKSGKATARDALRLLARSDIREVRDLTRAIAGRVDKAGLDVRVKYQERTIDDLLTSLMEQTASVGRYEPLEDAIYANDLTTEVELLHEVVHAATMRKLGKLPEAGSVTGRDYLEKLQRMVEGGVIKGPGREVVLMYLEAVEALSSELEASDAIIRNLNNPHGMVREAGEENYPLTSVDEFLAGLFTRPDFQARLKEHRYQGLYEKGGRFSRVRPTLWQKFIKWLGRLFGETDPRLLEASFGAGQRLMQARRDFKVETLYALARAEAESQRLRELREQILADEAKKKAAAPKKKRAKAKPIQQRREEMALEHFGEEWKDLDAEMRAEINQLLKPAKEPAIERPGQGMTDQELKDFAQDLVRAAETDAPSAALLKLLLELSNQKSAEALRGTTALYAAARTLENKDRAFRFLESEIETGARETLRPDNRATARSHFRMGRPITLTLGLRERAMFEQGDVFESSNGYKWQITKIEHGGKATIAPWKPKSISTGFSFTLGKAGPRDVVHVPDQLALPYELIRADIMSETARAQWLTNGINNFATRQSANEFRIGPQTATTGFQDPEMRLKFDGGIRLTAKLGHLAEHELKTRIGDNVFTVTEDEEGFTIHHKPAPPSMGEAGQTLYAAGRNAKGFAQAEREGRVFTGPDGEPRFELDGRQLRFLKEEGATLKDMGARIGLRPSRFDPQTGISHPATALRLDKVIDFPDLFANYPEARKIKLELRDLDGDGGFVEQTNTIVLNQGRNLGASLSTLIHEIQHWIQRREGWRGRGSHPDFEQSKVLKGAQDQGKVLDDKEMKRLARSAYWRNAGEVEARTVAMRRQMSPEERAAKPFYESSDTPQDRVLYAASRRIDEGSATATTPLERAALLAPTARAIVAELGQDRTAMLRRVVVEVSRNWEPGRGTRLSEAFAEELLWRSDTILGASPNRGAEDEWAGGPEPEVDDELAEILRGIEQDIAEMHRMVLHDQAIDALRDRALAEQLALPEGERREGDPRYANPGQTSAVRAAHGLEQERYQTLREKQTVEQWDLNARVYVGQFPTFWDAARDIIRTVTEGNPLSAVQTRGAMQIVNQIWNEAMATANPEKQRLARKLSWAYNKTGTANAQALTARRDPRKTPAQRNLEFITAQLTRLSPAAQKRVDDTPPKEREAVLQQEQDSQWARTEAELASAGFSLMDIFNGAALAKLRSSPEIQKVIDQVGKSPVERDALRMMIDGHSNRQIMKKTGLGAKGILEALEDNFDRALKPLFERWDATKVRLEDLTGTQPGSSTSSLGAAPDAAQRRNWLDWLKPRREVRNKGRVRKITSAPGQSPNPRFDINNVGHVVNLARLFQAMNATGYDALMEYWITSILSGPVTLFSNATGILNIGWEFLIQRPIEAMFNEALVRNPDAAQLGEARYLWRALLPIIKKALDRAWLAQKIEYSLFDDEMLNEPVDMQNLPEKGAGRVGMSENLFLQILGKTAWPKYLAVKIEEREKAIKAGSSEQEANLIAEQKAREALKGTFGYKAQQMADKTGLSQIFRGSRLRIPLRILLFTDQFYKYLAGSMQAAAEAYRIAKFEKLSDEAMEKRITELVAEPGSLAWQRAVAVAQGLTFTNQLRTQAEGAGYIEHWATRLQRLRSHRPKGRADMAGTVVLNFMLPFVQTPFRILQAGLRRTPLGTLGAMGRIGFSLSKGGLAKFQGGKFTMDYDSALMVRDMADSVQMMAFMLLLFYAAEGDGDDDDEKLLLISGSHPRGVESKGERELHSRMEGSPMMVRFGTKSNGFSIDYSRYEPFSTALSMLTDTMRAIKSKRAGATWEEFWDKLSGYYRSPLTDKTFLQGVGNIVELFTAIQEGKVKGKVEGIFHQTMSGFIPNAIRQPLRNLDDTQRSYYEQPLWYKYLPVGAWVQPEIDLYARPQTKQWSGSPLKMLRVLVDAGIDPSSNPYEGFDRFLREFDRLNLEWPQGVSFPSTKERFPYKKKVGGRWVDQKMSDAEAFRYEKKVGEEFRVRAHAMLSPYQVAHPDERTLRNVMNLLNDVRAEVRLAQFPSQAQYESER